MPTKLKQLPGTDEEVTCDNWREVQQGDYVWFVPEDAKDVDDVKLGIIASTTAAVSPDHIAVILIQGAPMIYPRKGRLSLAEPRPEEPGEPLVQKENNHGL